MPFFDHRIYKVSTLNFKNMQAENLYRGKRKIRAADLTDKVFDCLAEAIVPVNLLGDDLARRCIAKLWGVSRTPVSRSRRLLSSNFWKYGPHQRPLIRQITPGVVEKLYAIREILEILALKLALDQIRKIDPKVLMKGSWLAPVLRIACLDVGANLFATWSIVVTRVPRGRFLRLL